MISASPSKRLWFVIGWVAVWLVVYAWMGLPRAPLEILMILVLYVAIATPVRAVPVWLLLILFALGNVALTWSTAGIQFAVQMVTTRNDDVLGGVIAPITEEIAKILPIVVLYAWKRPRLRQSFGATDWMLCGAFVGAGVQLWEDIVARRNGIPSTAPHLFGVPLISGFMEGGRSAFAGHMVSTAFIALAIGWARYLRPRPGSHRPPVIAFAPAAFVMTWMIVDHAGNNLRNAHAWYWSAAHFVFSIGGRGRIAPYAFLIAFVATLTFETVLMARGSAAFGQWPPSMPIVPRLRWKLGELLLLHQQRYVQTATGITDPWELYREVRRSEPGWSLRAFAPLRKTERGSR